MDMRRILISWCAVPFCSSVVAIASSPDERQRSMQQSVQGPAYAGALVAEVAAPAPEDAPVVPPAAANTGDLPWGMLTEEERRELLEAPDLEVALRELGYSDFPDVPRLSDGRPTDVELIWYGRFAAQGETSAPLRSPTDNGWGTDESSDTAVNFVLNTPGALNPVGPTGATNFLGGGAFGPGGVAAGFMYVLDTSSSDPASQALYTMSLTTGALTLVGSSVPNNPGNTGESWGGMAWDNTTGTMYACAAVCGTGASLYTIDLVDGTPTLVASMTGSLCPIAIAIDCTGQMYAYDISQDTFGTVDKTTGTYTALAPLGFDANFGQGLGYDNQADTMYMAAFNNTTLQAELRIVDLNTGANTLVGPLGTPGVSQLGFVDVDQPPGPCPTGACCDDATGVCTDNVDSTNCTTRFVADTLCDDIVPLCGQIVGACCFSDGSCQLLTDAECASQGGSYSGDDTSCTPNECPQPCPCTSVINAFPYNEDFEGEVQCGTTCGNACLLLGDWTNISDGTDDFDWTSDVGGTTSTSTGPSQDANPGTPTGFYLYTESSGTACQNSTATLLSPCFDFSTLATPQLIFGYHMYGADMGDLYVEVSDDSCISWTTEVTISGPQQGDNTDPWLYAVVDLGAYAGMSNVRIRFRGVSGDGFNSDMAIDDITVQEAQEFTGACCDGTTCTGDMTQAECEAGGGAYQGEFTNCGPPNPCSGACCLPDGSCVDTTSDDCAAQGGSYQGDGTDCALNPCPPVNDTCETAVAIVSLPFFTTVDNSLATAGAPPGTCNTSSATVMQNDVWYSFTPTEDCYLILDVDPDFGDGYDGLMQIYTGPDCNNLTELGGLPGEDDPGCYDLNEPWHVEFGATAGLTYWFQIGDWGTSAGGGLTSLCMTCQVGTVGACCHPDGSCTEEMGQAACESTGGFYQGDATSCCSASCPQPCSCTSPIGTFPHNEDFEGEPTCGTTCGNSCVLVGDWTNIDDGTDDMDWTIDEGGTSSSNTGPDVDANPGTVTGNYAYTETSGTSCQNATAILLSPCYDISGLSDPLLLFAYHMYGSDMGELNVEVSTDDCASWTTELSISGEQQFDETDPWIYDLVDLTPYAGATDLRIRFRGVTGDGFESDMAIDDIRVVNGPLTGACCEADGSCTDNVAQADCEAGGGRWQGPFTQCADIPSCGGACCTSAGCFIEPQDTCEAGGGTYLGDDTVCSAEDCNGDGIPDICDPDCNANGVSDVCDILGGTSEDCQPDDIPDECQLTGGAPTVVLSEMDLGSTDALEIQNVSGGVLATAGWTVAISDTPYGDPTTVNPIIQALPATMAAGEIMYWTDGTTNPWGNNMFWNPGDFPSFSGWAMILNDTGAIVDFAVWNGMPQADIQALSLTINSHTVTIGDEWLMDGIVTGDECGSGFSVQRQGSNDHNDATDWTCQPTNLGMQNPGLITPFTGGGNDCNSNGTPDDCDVADCPPGDVSCADCNTNSKPDECDIAECPPGDVTCGDCNTNGVPDGCELSGQDCNANGIDDECDIDSGFSFDYDLNGVPDECDPDCNTNGVPDVCDIDCSIGDCASHPGGCGASEDCQPDGIPDDCQLGGGAETLVFSQDVIPDDNGIGPGLLLAIGSSCPFDNTSAEDFTLASSRNLTRVTWVGVYFGAASDFPGEDNNFRMTFYEDNGSGNVGAVIADFPSLTVAKALHPRPPVFGTNPAYTYEAILPAAVPINGGQRYWLSINGDPAGASGPVFGWMASAEGNAASIPGNDQPLQNTAITCVTLPAATYTPGGDLGDQDADLAFALYGTVGSGSGADCNSNNIPDECDIRDCPPGDLSCADCNSDGVPDGCQLVDNDCNANQVPDDCEPDCNENGIADECDIRDCPPGDLSCADCQPDGIPDGCQLYDSVATTGVVLTEKFDDITTLPGDGWVKINNSEPLGSTDWFQGNSSVFPAHDGAATAYTAANYNNCGDGAGLDTISNWLITPELTLSDGMTLSFWTRKSDIPPSMWPDRLEVRMSLAGSSSDVGPDEFSVGDFTSLLLEINPSLILGDYPDVWTEFSVTLAGIGAPTNGRFAFRYFVTDAGPDGTNSDYIGIDTVMVEQPAGPPLNDCNENMVPDECDIADGVSSDCNGNTTPDECEDDPVYCGGLDIKPGSCPNPFNRKSHGVLPVGLLGTADFDVSMVDITTLRLKRVDGVGGAVAPNEGPPGPQTVYEDVGTPFDGMACDCHELTGDGIMDLSMKFRTDDVVDELELDALPLGAQVELVVTGNLLGGASFVSPVDCILIVPMGSADLTVESSVPNLFVDLAPLDEKVDGGGFPLFSRTYDPGTQVTAQVPSSVDGRAFRFWEIDGVRQPRGQRVISVTMIGDVHLVPFYGPRSDNPLDTHNQEISPVLQDQ